ncbi:MAG: 50S ribosomal protein L9 [Parcubacteria group bacterium]|nr:50S ribosomal protein L9 [Parcubacteria group bacterium]
MKVILIKDVSGVGVKDDIKVVSDGHAMNFLIPNGLAEFATDKRIKEVGELKREQAKEDKEREDTLIKNMALLNKVSIEIKQEANEKGHLFKGISQADIAKRLKKETGITIPHASIQLKAPIKETGEFAIEVENRGGKGVFKLVISKN